jgi:hypothetical protein
VDLIDQDENARLLVVDPAFVLTLETVKKLVRWAQEGGTVVLPRSPLYTDAAAKELDLVAAGSSQNFDINFGIPYKLHETGEGKLIVYDLPEGIHPKGELASAWHTFVQAALGVADIREVCRFSDGRLSAVPLVQSGDGRSLGLFVLNSTTRTVAADILFKTPVSVSDLAITMAGGGKTQAAAPGTRFSLEVPPRGILPVAVDGVSVEAEERRKAARLARETQASAMAAATAELAGFNPSAASVGDADDLSMELFSEPLPEALNEARKSMGSAFDLGTE